MFIYRYFLNSNDIEITSQQRDILDDVAKHIPLSEEAKSELIEFSSKPTNSKALREFCESKNAQTFKALQDLGIHRYPAAFEAIDAQLEVPSFLIDPLPSSPVKSTITYDKEKKSITIVAVSTMGDETKIEIPWSENFNHQKLRDEYFEYLQDFSKLANLPLLSALATSYKVLKNYDHFAIEDLLENAVLTPEQKEILKDSKPPVTHKLRIFLQSLLKQDLDQINRSYEELVNECRFTSPDIIPVASQLLGLKVLDPAQTFRERLKKLVPDLAISHEELNRIALLKFEEFSAFLENAETVSDLIKKREFAPLVEKMEELQSNPDHSPTEIARVILETIAKDLISPEVQKFYSFIAQLQVIPLSEEMIEKLKAAYLSNQGVGRGKNYLFQEGFREVFAEFVTQVGEIHTKIKEAKSDAANIGMAPPDSLKNSLLALRGMAKRLNAEELIDPLQKEYEEALTAARSPKGMSELQAEAEEELRLSKRAYSTFEKFKQQCIELEKVRFSDRNEALATLKRTLESLKLFPNTYRLAEILMRRASLDDGHIFHLGELALTEYKERQFQADVVARNGVQIGSVIFPRRDDGVDLVTPYLKEQGVEFLKPFLTQVYPLEILGVSEFSAAIRFNRLIPHYKECKLQSFQNKRTLVHEYFVEGQDKNGSTKATYFVTITTDILSGEATLSVVPSIPKVIDKYGPKVLPKEAEESLLAYSKALTEGKDPRKAYQNAMQVLDSLGGQEDLMEYLRMEDNPEFLPLWKEEPHVAKGLMRLYKEDPAFALELRENLPMARVLAPFYLVATTSHRHIKDKQQLPPDFEQKALYLASEYRNLEPKYQEKVLPWLEKGILLSGVTFSKHPNEIFKEGGENTFARDVRAVGLLINDNPISRDPESLERVMTAQFGKQETTQLQRLICQHMLGEYSIGVHLEKIVGPNELMPAFAQKPTPYPYTLKKTATHAVITKTMADFIIVNNQNETLGTYDVVVKIEIPLEKLRGALKEEDVLFTYEVGRLK